ncbi:unnamed protein product [Closterium sp. NIES-64]|nr:unnamed protein product [Closterium sp. NIES-64]CAI5994684.1 unnamed protein product [Closterium sp. NIES-65]
MNHRHLSTLFHLPRLVHLSTLGPYQTHQQAGAASVTLPSFLKSLIFFKSCPSLNTIFSSASPATGLEELMISNYTELTSLAEPIGDLLPCLRKLTILPTRLDILVGLKRLELTGCEELSRPPAHLPTSLETLCLGSFRRGASHVVDISQLSQLRVLKLNCVGVRCGRAVSSRFSCPQQLEILEMYLERDSQELPVFLTSICLPSLRSLLICAPRVCSLPVNMVTAFPQLLHLRLLSWLPEELPGVLLELRSLTSLAIEAPQLVALPQGMSCLSRLRKLELIGCSALEHLPESLTQLHHLILNCTSVPYLPPIFVRLRR